MKKKKKEELTGLEPEAADETIPRPKRLTPIDVQQQEFRLSFRGYSEKDVDEFLDRITEEFTALNEENKRLKRGAGIPSGDAARREAEEIRQQAQADADRIVADARARASASAGASPGPVASQAVSAEEGVYISRFIGREREFLHGLAGMIQEHAESVKETVREARKAAPAPATSEASSPGDPEPAPHPAIAELSGSPDDVAGRSSWDATASPAAAPSSESPSGFGSMEASSSVATERQTVVSIPPSPVDSPMEDVAGEQAVLETGAAEAAESEPEADEQDPFMTAQRRERTPASKPQSERSLREMFWGEE